MYAVFVELPAFSRHRKDYIDDEGLRELQIELLIDPTAGDLLEGSGGLRRLRHRDVRRGKGKRGGLRVIYFWWEAGRQFWLFTIYDKSEMDDLGPTEKRALRAILKLELDSRR